MVDGEVGFGWVDLGSDGLGGVDSGNVNLGRVDLGNVGFGIVDLGNDNFRGSYRGVAGTSGGCGVTIPDIAFTEDCETLQDDYETQLACVTVPFLSRMVQSGEFSLGDVMRAMDFSGKMEMGRKVVEIIPKERVAVFAYMLGMFVRADAGGF
ncbi:unnamed protein product [Anisakis simplex]|uniref:Peptidase A1 domain-containing protein n=1 Tax=Anisakis simplex TaxID=6269 RepID=A0A0M3JA97_ANISI|nr:unnamed protein product [Anisakis simplex]